jgi:hypothetical protein
VIYFLIFDLFDLGSLLSNPPSSQLSFPPLHRIRAVLPKDLEKKRSRSPNIVTQKDSNLIHINMNPPSATKQLSARAHYSSEFHLSLFNIACFFTEVPLT